MEKLKGKTAVITGANSGIGYATAKLFLQEGARVIITGRNEKSVTDAVQSLGKGAFGIVSDAGRRVDLEMLAGKVASITPVIDILFANAGIASFVPFAETTEEQFDSMMDINFKGAFFTIQKLLPLIPDCGAVILTSSILAHSGLEGSSAYTATKGAVITFSRALAAELAGKAIRVNSVTPGPINTPIYGKLGIPREMMDSFAAEVAAKVPLKRFGEAEEIAKAVLFLASADSSYMTGGELVIDGGKAMSF